MEEAGDARTSAETELPAAMATSWARDQRIRRGPRPALSVDSLARAAIALADAEGLGAVSMARVAKAVGVTSMALYRYVSSKDELLALMADTATPLEHVDDAGLPWRARLERWCRDQMALFVEHPWLVELIALPVFGPNRAAWLERGLTILQEVSAPEAVKTSVIGMLSLHLLTEAGTLVAFPRAAEEADLGLRILLDGVESLFRDFAALG